MRMYDLIIKKRDGGKFNSDEIQYVVNQYTNGNIEDYQMSALLMAIFIKGMDLDETVELTKAMANSGDMLDLSEIEGIKVDKHSTGGIGDKTTLIIGPLLAACNVPVAKMSGRGLGHTGGTIDKLESFPGFKTTIPEEEFIRNVNEIKMSIVGQTANLAPADKKIYALRDVTGTVDNYSLIASSIMSKKLAAGSDAIVLDVKCGSGAFMKNEEDAIHLAKVMVSIGVKANRETIAVISDMSQPLGKMVGNALEVKEAIEVLNGKGDHELLELSLVLASHMMVAAKKAESIDEAREKLMEVIVNKDALNKLAEFVERQGGNSESVYNTELLPRANYVSDYRALNDGYINCINANEIGMASMVLGGGRETKQSVIDLSVGIRINKKIGEKVRRGDIIALIYGNDNDKILEAKSRLENAYTIEDEPIEPPILIKRIITKDDL